MADQDQHASQRTDGGLYGSSTTGSAARAAVAELVGTFILVLSGIAVATAAILQRPIAGAPFDSLAVGLAFGIALVALVTALGHVSGAHLNPAVTLGLTVTGKFPIRLAPIYLAAQLAGAVLAALATWGALGDDARSQARLAATAPAAAASLGQVVVIELVVTFVLVFVVVSVATDDRVPAAAAGLAVGLALAVGVMIAGPVSGGAVNPARALGPMIVAGSFEAWWAYLVGPLVGGAVAALLYDRFVAQASAPTTS